MSAHPAPRRPDPLRGTRGERVAGHRRRLQDVAVDLAQATEPERVAARIVDAACDGLRANHGWVGVVTPDGTAAEIVCARGHDPGIVAAWQRVPLSLDVPVAEVIRTGRPVYAVSAAERLGTFPAIAERGGPAAGVETFAAVPIAIDGRPIGALGVSFDAVRDLDADERWYLGALASQGAQAIERSRLFAALREQGERLRFALEASGTGTWDWDVAADEVSWSAEIHGFHDAPSRTLGGNLRDFLERVHPDDRDRVADEIRRSLATQSAVDVELRFLRADGSVRWTHVLGRLLADPAGRPLRMLGTSHDITDRKLAEAERDRFLEAERETARLRDAFIGVVSHELRTPITTIYGGTRVLARRWRELDPDARDGILADVVEEADRLYRLTEDLLVLTRVERGTLEVGDEPIHLGRLLERVIGSEQARWPDVAFEVRGAQDLPSVHGEDTYVEQVLRNLLGNAAKYGGAGSTVMVQSAATATDVSLTILDEGPGIDEAEADRLFDLFYRSPTVAGSVAGAGIGLFVCRQLVAAMGGGITAERRPDGGAAFVVTLPRYADDEVG